MPDTPETETTQAESTEATTTTDATTVETDQNTQAHASVGAPYEGLLQQAAEEKPYVPGEITIIGQAEPQGAPVSGVPTEGSPATETTPQATE